MSEELDILGFDPSQLSVFSTNEGNQFSNVNKNIYVAKPSETKSEDGVYYAKIKVIYSPLFKRSKELPLTSRIVVDCLYGLTANNTISSNTDYLLYKP